MAEWQNHGGTLSQGFVSFLIRLSLLVSLPLTLTHPILSVRSFSLSRGPVTICCACVQYQCGQTKGTEYAVPVRGYGTSHPDTMGPGSLLMRARPPCPPFPRLSLTHTRPEPHTGHIPRKTSNRQVCRERPRPRPTERGLPLQDEPGWAVQDGKWKRNLRRYSLA